jgi:hypothetical protein
MKLRSCLEIELSNALVDLVEELRGRDSELSLRHYILLHDLVMLTISERGGDVELSSLQTVFGPVLCTSPYEQSRFASFFPEWVARFEQRVAGQIDIHSDLGARRRINTDLEDVSGSERQLEDLFDKTRAARRRTVLIGIGLGALALVAAAFGFLR